MLLAGDVELLLSYLTVPYLCQPLLLRFFCRHDRVLALRDPALREMLQAALFEPGRIVLSRNASECPQQVPATGRAEMALVGSPNGQLLLELTHSPQPLLEALARVRKTGIGCSHFINFNDSRHSFVHFKALRPSDECSHIRAPSDERGAQVPAKKLGVQFAESRNFKTSECCWDPTASNEGSTGLRSRGARARPFDVLGQLVEGTLA